MGSGGLGGLGGLGAQGLHFGTSTVHEGHLLDTKLTNLLEPWILDAKNLRN